MALDNPRKLWEHPNPERTEMWRFKETVNQKRRLNLKTYEDLFTWSCEQNIDFWQDLWEYSELIHEGSYKQVVDPSARMDSVPRWFQGIRLNWAENILFNRGPSPGSHSKKNKEDDKVALTEVRENTKSEPRYVTWGELRLRVGRMVNAMRRVGISRGDRVAVVASNSIDTLAVFLGVPSLGGIFSSSSTDMGVKGVLDRMTQIEPKYIFVDDWAVYNGKTIDLRPKMKGIVEGMKNVPHFKGIVSQPRFRDASDIRKIPKCQTLENFLAGAEDTLTFERVAFHDPFLIVYSSGTTGQPKCIVHSVGGVLLNAKKEVGLHRQVSSDSLFLQYTTTGWIMYLLQVQVLVCSASIVLYDGSLFHPDTIGYVRLIGDLKVTHLGTSPRYLHELQKADIIPNKVTNTSSLVSVSTTGMVLAEPLFEWFYTAFPSHTQLANISGGTDIAASFACENPLSPLYVGGIQNYTLGVPVEIYDADIEGGKGVEGRPVANGTPGELVGTKPFPNMPVMFWGKNGKQRYFDAYFSRFDNVWTHGDFIMKHPVSKAVIFLGRADGVLNPSGIRFGSAEIYNIIEREFSGEVSDSLCVGQRRPRDPDETVMLFLLMRSQQKLDKGLVQRIKDAIAKGLSRRHVPKYIFETPEIPTTINGKKVELPVKQIVSGKTVKPSSTLANPQSLQFYYQFAKIENIEPRSKL